ncbi:MAG: rubrerythrin family protein [Clostridia bacterium]|nr:rubrerythrin family protein [Clostridia bacterium]
MKELKGTKTEANLMAAFAGESQARNKYTFFEAKAREDKFIEIADIFKETAENERAHAELWYKLLSDGIGQSLDNLKSARDGERYEWKTMYPEFAKTAREEGFEKIAVLFELVAEIEKRHDERFEKLIGLIEEGHLFLRDGEVWWQCINCGYTVRLKDAPDHCPVCGQPQGYFKAENERK